MLSKMKCPNCGNSDYSCVDGEADFTESNLTYTWLCYCDKCNFGFDIVAKLKWDNFKYENIHDLLLV